MSVKRLTLAAALLALAAPAHAAEPVALTPESRADIAAGALRPAPSAAPLRKVDGDEPLRTDKGLSVRDLKRLPVISAAGDPVGDVEAVLADPNDRITAVVIEAGGFLGLGSKKVVVGLKDLMLDSNRLIAAMSSDEMKKLPAWND